MRSRLRRAVASSTKAMSWAKPDGGDEPPERVGGQFAGVEEPVDGPVQGEFGRRPGEDERIVSASPQMVRTINPGSTKGDVEVE